MHLLVIALIVLTIYCKPFRPIGVAAFIALSRLMIVWILSAAAVLLIFSIV